MTLKTKEHQSLIAFWVTEMQYITELTHPLD